MSGQCASPATEIVATPTSSVGLNRAAIGLIAVGGALSAIALFGDASRARFGFAYVWGFSFLWTTVLGCLFFVGLQHLTHSVWSVVIRRVAEMFTASVGLVGVLFLPMLLLVLLPNAFHVYPWTDAGHVEHDPVLHAKSAYLNAPFFLARAAVFFAIWIAFSKYFVNTSLAQDQGEGGAEASLAMRKRSAPFMLIFAVTATFAGIDWLMSLDPHWFSTIFGVYVFAGMVLASLAVTTIATVSLRDAGRLGSDVVTGDHLYSLGALLFAFTCFWAYIAFSQYMLIWYANIPEETSYLFRRLRGDWLSVSIVLALVRFAIPFFVLLSRRAKMHPRILLWVSVLILGGQLLDLYWLVMPEMHREHPVLGWQELGPPLLVSGALMLFVSRFLGRHAAIAVGDPLLEESRRFHL